jgi:hypothetical protein
MPAFHPGAEATLRGDFIEILYGVNNFASFLWRASRNMHAVIMGEALWAAGSRSYLQL